MDYAEQRFSSRQAAGIAFVVLFHIAVIYALVSGLGEQAIQVLRQPLQAKIITPTKPPLPEAPPPPPMLAPPPPFIPPPLIQIAQPPPPPVIASVTHVQPAAPRPPAPGPQPAVRSTAAMDAATCPTPQYPEAAQDMEEYGTTTMQVLISTSGTLLSSRIAVSSGHRALDDAALAAFSQCKYTPAIGADGKPQPAWLTLRYIWQPSQD